MKLFSDFRELSCASPRFLPWPIQSRYRAHGIHGFPEACVTWALYRWTMKFVVFCLVPSGKVSRWWYSGPTETAWLGKAFCVHACRQSSGRRIGENRQLHLSHHLLEPKKRENPHEAPVAD